MSTLRALHVIPSVAPRYGGPSQAVFEMCRALQAQNCETFIATTDADGQERLPVKLGSVLAYEEVPSIFFSRQWSEAFKYSWPLSRWLDTNVKSFDVVHIHAVFSHACLSAAKACRKSGVPYIVRPLGTLDPWSMRQKPFRKRLMWHVAAARMMREAAAVHYTTSDEKNLAEKSLGINHGVVIPLGVETEQLNDTSVAGIFRQQHPLLGENPYVLVLSRIHPKKNLEMLVEAFLKVTEQPELKGWRLVIAGEGDAEYISSLRHLAQNSMEGSNILFPGWLEGGMKISALQDAALLALTSRQENFGLCVVEALACGVPALVSEYVNLATEIESSRAGWVTKLELTNLADVLKEALYNDEKRKRRGKAGQDFVVNHFSWPTLAERLINLYGFVAKGPLKSDAQAVWSA